MSYLAKTPEGLLPCPHCGGEAEARDGSSTTPYIRCKSCGCRTGSSWDVDKLKEAWNRRTWCDRDALLALAEDVDGAADDSGVFEPLAGMLRDIARRIRDALGVTDG